MSQQQPVICEKCGLPKAPKATQQTPRRKFTSRELDDIADYLKRLDASNEPVVVNGRRMGVPPIPSFIPKKEQITINPANRAVPQTEEKPVYDRNGRRMGVPPIPSFLPPVQRL